MTLNEIPNFLGGAAAQTPLGGLTAPPKPPAVCTKPLRGFVFPRYARPHQFLGGSAAPAYYFKKGYKWRLHHNTEISIRTLKRRLQTYGLQRKICNITEDSLKQIISKVSYRINIKRDVEMKLLRKVDPNGS